MPQYSWEFSASYNRFEIRPHDAVDATHFREPVDFIYVRAVVSQCVLQGFNGNINADLVPVLEAVGNCLRGAVDADRNTFNSVGRDPRGKRLPGKPDDAERWRLQGWLACFVVYGDPDLVRV